MAEMLIKLGEDKVTDITIRQANAVDAIDMALGALMTVGTICARAGKSQKEVIWLMHSLANDAIKEYEKEYGSQKAETDVQCGKSQTGGSEKGAPGKRVPAAGQAEAEPEKIY